MLERAAQLIASHRDVVEERVADGEAPHALVARGWDEVLLALTDDELDALEVLGLDAPWPEGAPGSLLDMLDEARAVCALPSLTTTATASRQRPRETPRKRAQIDAFASVIVPLVADARRVVDVGCGHGHLTRDLAARIERPIVGLERDATLAARARAMSGAAFATVDVLAEGLPLRAGDCAIGLHACGELGDAIVAGAAHASASVALVSCCLQKRRSATRVPLASDLEVSSRVLGLSNLTPGDVGVEATRRENLVARERRLALHRLLAERLGPFRFGAEIDGLNRRVAHASLDVLVARAFTHRGMPLPSPVEVAEAARWARVQHARARRLSLPRAMLARPLEVFVLYDRARHLEQRGYRVETGVIFPAAVSARNLALLARK